MKTDREKLKWKNKKKKKHRNDNNDLLNDYLLPDTVLSTLRAISHLILCVTF